MSVPLDRAAAARWTEEAIRVYRRYEVEVVHACDLCPWATRVRSDGRVAERVLLQNDPGEVEPSLDAMSALDSAEIDVALLLYPRLDVDRARFEHFATRLRNADVARRPLGDVPFVMAVFHPEAEADLTDPERLIPFLRRTPDPTLQLLRTKVLERVRRSTPQGTQFIDPRALATLEGAPEQSLREMIAAANLATTLRVGVDAVAHRFRDIARDRRESYAALVPPTP